MEGCFEVRLLPLGESPKNLLDSELGVRSRGEPRSGWKHLGFLPSFRVKRTGAVLLESFGQRLRRGDVLRVGENLTGIKLLVVEGFAYWLCCEEGRLVPLGGPQEQAARAYETLFARGIFRSIANLAGNKRLCKVLFLLLEDVLAEGSEQALRGVVQKVLTVLAQDTPERAGLVARALRGGLPGADSPYVPGVLLEEAWLARRAVSEALFVLENLDKLGDLHFPKYVEAYFSLVKTGTVLVWTSAQWGPAFARRAARGERLPREQGFVAPEEVLEDLAERLVRLCPLGDLLLSQWDARNVKD